MSTDELNRRTEFMHLLHGEIKKSKTGRVDPGPILHGMGIEPGPDADRLVNYLVGTGSVEREPDGRVRLTGAGLQEIEQARSPLSQPGEHVPPFAPPPVAGQPDAAEPGAEPPQRPRRLTWRRIGAFLVGFFTIAGAAAAIYAVRPDHSTPPAPHPQAVFKFIQPPTVPTLTERCTFVAQVKGRLPQGKALVFAYQEAGSDTSYPIYFEANVIQGLQPDMWSENMTVGDKTTKEGTHFKILAVEMSADWEKYMLSVANAENEPYWPSGGLPPGAKVVARTDIYRGGC